MTRVRHREGGGATAELAVALPTLVLVLAVALAALDLGVAQVRCVDAARVGARLLARGEPAAGVLHEVRAAAPEGARVSTAVSGGRVVVVVAGQVPGTLKGLGVGLRPSATAVAVLEAPV